MAPERGRRTSWETFLRSHWGAIAAADFFTVEVLTMRSLVRCLVFFVIDLKSRRVEIAGMARVATGAWVEQIARNLTDPNDGFLHGSSFLINDRDPLFTRAVGATLRGGGVTPIRLPARSPNLNAYAERFVRSTKSECLAKVIPLGEHHLRRTVTEYTRHYHLERNHQGLGNRLIEGFAERALALGRVERRERLGGLLDYYYREVA